MTKLPDPAKLPEGMPELPQQIGYVSRDNDKLRFTERVYGLSLTWEIAGQRQFQPVITAEQAEEYGLACYQAGMERAAGLVESMMARNLFMKEMCDCEPAAVDMIAAAIRTEARSEKSPQP
jgi:hypothetical protein